MSFTNFTTKKSISFGGEYRELVQNERLRYTDNFDDPNLAGEIQTTVTLKEVSLGTEIVIVQEGLPAVIPLEACYVGWQQSLDNLAKLVEPEIPDWIMLVSIYTYSHSYMKLSSTSAKIELKDYYFRASQ